MNLDKYKKVGIDTNIFIYHFYSHLEFGPLVKDLFASLQANKIKGITSAITITELLGFKEPAGSLRLLEEKFLTTPNLSIVDTSQTIALTGARIRREYGFRTPDAIQLATALVGGAKAFITNDDEFDRFKEIDVLLLGEVKLKED
ncbi:MAG: PIN domain-containing protein [Candidatus Blackburnbacteria bacterium]|nr:PIN domain-containing protein [Candidatus Blackburnbacteria bacterium]